MKKTDFIKRIFAVATIVLLFFTAPAVHAQTGFEDDVDDEIPQDPETPIDSLLLVGLLAGTFLGYRLLRNPEQST